MGVFMRLCVKGQSGKVRWVCFCVCDRELRALVIEMVLATDMSSHLVQVKAIKGCLQQHEGYVLLHPGHMIRDGDHYDRTEYASARDKCTEYDTIRQLF